MNNHQEALVELIKTIKERNGKPVNVQVVMATIESLGIRDIDVPSDYGFSSIEDLAHYIFAEIGDAKLPELKNKKQLAAEQKEFKKISVNNYMIARKVLFVKEYSTGLFHTLPVFIQIACIVFFGFSLWTFSGFNGLQSTAVVLGVIIGLVTTGGFVQVMGKQVSYYWYNQDYEMTRKSVINILKTGIKIIFILFVIITIINFFLYLYPFVFVGIVFIYALLISILLLSLSSLYTIKERWVISAVIFIATSSALAVHLFTAIKVYYIHWGGIVFASILALAYLHFFFKRTIKKDKGRNNAVPKMMLSVYRNFDYFFYGILIFLFVFTDRILAWSSTLERNLPYIVYYEKDYEIGMDLAILVFFLLAGVLEYSITSFCRYMDYYQRTIAYHKLQDFNKKMLQMYYKHLRLFAGSAILIGILLYAVITKPWGYKAGFDESLSALSIKVCIIGGFGYLFLTLGMLNVLYMYTLNQHKKPLTAIILACFINVGIGVLCSRIISYEYSAIGLLIGAFFFMAYTTRLTIRFFKRLDYFYYAAY